MPWFVPILIFFGRICDVSLGTFRTILVANGHKHLAAFLGFFEVIIWALAASGAIIYVQQGSVSALLAYGAGFACGVLVGMTIEERVALGYRVVRVISMQHNGSLCGTLRNRDWRVTRVDGSGRDGPVEIAFLVIKRRQMKDLVRTLKEIAPDAFVTVERVDRPVGANFRESRFGLKLGGRISQIVK